MKMLLLQANKLWDSISREEETMPKSAQRKMWLEQQHDPEWRFIEVMDSLGTSDVDMFNWAIFILRLQLVWIRKWKHKNMEEITFCREMEENARRRTYPFIS